MKVYNFPFGPYPQRVRIYLAEKGVTGVELVEFDAPTSKANWPPAFIAALTPTGSLPIIVDDDGTAVTQSLAILEYLEDTRPVPDMRGVSSADRARTRELVNVFDEALTSFALWARYGSDLSRSDKREYRDVITIGAERFFEKLRLAERMIEDTQFLAGDGVTIADCVAMATLQYTIGFYDVPIPLDCNRLSNWYMRFTLRASAAKCDFPAEQHRIARHLMTQTNITL
jgi:glutathione S-transferase